jgi:hypothetical protein
VIADVLYTGTVTGVGMLLPKLSGSADTVHDGANCAITVKVVVSAPTAAWDSIMLPAPMHQALKHSIERFMSSHRDEGDGFDQLGVCGPNRSMGIAACKASAQDADSRLADPESLAFRDERTEYAVRWNECQPVDPALRVLTASLSTLTWTKLVGGRPVGAWVPAHGVSRPGCRVDRAGSCHGCSAASVRSLRQRCARRTPAVRDFRPSGDKGSRSVAHTPISAALAELE